ncbi:hypothetical protein [Mucilaginibacter ginsenosidivorans]|uniref:Uncharacterized protein n=1 Tax=Mucilaginibacter ginsenosidivorans TaxID=398053 RepID=A0A5B8UTU6_9SPHI|nr:hypothetical protein [Mucilaginibacter ginsenosidivorans]QEC62165.1 hypothetical protein FRZ54_06065 [Mucilaginibacter ginsenosidivorans]
MKRVFTALLFLCTASSMVSAQKSVDKVKFFTDTSVLNGTLSFNFKKVISNRDKEGAIFPATFICNMEGLEVHDPIQIEVRGHFRRAHCYLPPLKLIYKNDPSAAFYQLKSLKLVSACMTSNADDQNLLKEFLIYKMYNLLCEKSFRVRLLNLTYLDSAGKKNPLTRHAFLIEDAKQLAKRNDCEEWNGRKIPTERTDRKQMTMVAVFEYMIGNTDWSVPVEHNIKILHSKTDSLSRPYAVPYDFDFSGLVNTNYAAPDEHLGTSTVRERVYRGFPRTMDELHDVLNDFKKQKDNIYALINNFNLLSLYTKKDMIKYLDEFYDKIDNDASVKSIFVNNARVN